MAFTGSASSPLRWIPGIAVSATALFLSPLFSLWLAICLALVLVGIPGHLAAAGRSKSIFRPVDSLATVPGRQFLNLSHIADNLAKRCGSLHESTSTLSGAAIADRL